MSESEDRWSVSLSGVTLLGRYAVERKMGGGGMATVYLAKDEHLGLPVVVKVPHPAFLADPSFRTRFEQETDGLIALQHPHIVRILARGEHEGLPFLVMQYLPGGSLGDRLRKADGKPLPYGEIAPWLAGVTEALDFIHGQRIVHRDIKPDNVLFDEHGYVYLSDFGIAKAIGADDTGLTATGATPGSPAYMAPEQARTSNLEGSSDQYSLAASLYETLSGKPAYDGETLVDVLLKKQSEDPAHLAELVPDVPLSAANAIMRALSRDPSRRYPTCAAFLDATRQAAATTTMEVPHVEAPPPPSPPMPAAAAPQPAELPPSPFRRYARYLALALILVVAPLLLLLDRSKDETEQGAPAAAPAAVGRYVLDRKALERMKGRGPRPPRPRGARPGRRPDLDAWMKGGMSLDVRADGTFEMAGAPGTGRGAKTTGTWRVGDGDELRFETTERDGRTPRILPASITGTGLTLRFDRLQIPFLRTSGDRP